MSKLDADASQFSLDRKSPRSKQQLKQVKDAGVGGNQNQKVLRRLERGSSLKRAQSPEIINIHRGAGGVLYDGYVSDNCAVKSYGYDKDFKCDEYGFRRAHSFKRTSDRYVTTPIKIS